jgi:hypothetical protein
LVRKDELAMERVGPISRFHTFVKRGGIMKQITRQRGDARECRIIPRRIATQTPYSGKRFAIPHEIEIRKRHILKGKALSGNHQ